MFLEINIVNKTTTQKSKKTVEFKYKKKISRPF